MELYYDFHLHSCLSPCGDKDMTPYNIVNMAKILGMDAIVCAMFFGLLSGGGYAAFMLATKRLKKSDQFAFGPFLAFGLAVAALWGDQIAAWYLSAL